MTQEGAPKPIPEEEKVQAAASIGGFKMNLNMNAAKKPANSLLPPKKTLGGEDEESSLASSASSSGSKQSEMMITEFDGLEKKEVKKTLVIPMILQNDWRNTSDAEPAAEKDSLKKPEKQEEKEQGNKEEGNPGKTSEKPLTLDEQAAKAILKELQASGGESGEAAEALVLPLMKVNQPPGLDDIADEREKFKRDVEMRPEVCTLEEYENVPVEEFGAAMLRGMGWSEGKAIGKHGNGLAQPIMYVARHDRLGLGAAPKPVIEEPPPKKFVKQGESRDRTNRKNLVAPTDESGRTRHVVTLDEKLVERETDEVKIGTKVIITRGRHEGMKGKVNYFERDFVVVTLDLNGVDARVEKEYVENRRVYERNEKERKDRDKDRDRNREKEKDRERDRDRDRDRDQGKSRRDDDRKAEEPPSKKSKSERPWLFPFIQIRVISKSFQGGKYYTKKAVIEDVVLPSGGGEATCTIKIDGKHIDGVPQSALETVVPKPGGNILGVRGEFRNQAGVVLDKSNSSSVAKVRLTADERIVDIPYDDLSEYVGEDL